MHDLAKKHGGKCLSKDYLGAKNKLLWKCKEGHEWMARPDNIKHGRWCPKCKKHKPYKYSIEDMQNIAAKKNGRCLSKTFVGVKEKLEWECSQGHQWKATPDNVLNGHWCFKCRPKRSSLTLDEMKVLAEARGGKCLSEIYTKLSNQLHWQCSNGHEWYAAAANIKHAKCWCPYCTSTSIGEAICRQVLEATFGVDFPRRRPKWLLSENGIRLELDGYNELAYVAFEYQGPHHYGEWHHHKSKEDYESQARRDGIKIEATASRGINLIVIRQFNNLENQNEIFSTIQSAIYRAGLTKIVKKIPLIFGSSELNTLKEIALSRGGKLLSPMYLGNNKKLEWECAEGHRWKAVPQNIIRAKSWCPKCARVALLELSEFHLLAKKRGGRCLSTEYIGISSPLKWECAKGHQWEVSPINIKHNNTWCPYCAGKRKTINDMNILASTKGGVCVSDIYINPTTKLIWKCSVGHNFLATPNKVQQGSWCPLCARMRSNRRAS